MRTHGPALPRSVIALLAVTLAAAPLGRAGAASDAASEGHTASRADRTERAAPPAPPAPPEGDVAGRLGRAEVDHVGDVAATPAALPTGGDKTGVSSQAISIPQGSGKIQGMGESFSTQMSTGAATFTVPLMLPRARGGSAASLELTYSSASGHGVAGVGWELPWAYVARQTDRGLPLYDDRAEWHPQQDRFVFNGGQELVPICVVHGATCAAKLPEGEAMPAWADGWQYFRARVEGAYLRFFWSPDHRTWRVQSKGGESLEIGVPLDGSGDTGALEVDPQNPARIFRWNLARQYDDEGTPPPAGAAQPAPANAIVYRYESDGGLAYLADLYLTPPAANPAHAALTTYAHHVHLAYEARPDATASYRRGWRTSLARRVSGADVTSAPFAVGSARRAVRRYHFAYDADYHVSLLTSVQIEGRCAGAEAAAPAEDAAGRLPPATGCPALPPMTFGYQHVTPFGSDGAPGTRDLPGYEGFDERLVWMKGSPPASIDEQLADLFDINSDALPDLVVTTPGPDAKFPLYLGGAGGVPEAFGVSGLGVQGVLGATSSSIRLSNDNVAVCDLDGDGVVDWLHQPAARSYAVYTPARVADGWTMVGRAVPASARQDPHLDLGDDAPDIHVFDANGDGLVDVVRATGTTLQTFFALGRYPGGDGNFGSARWTGAATADLSLQFVSSCVPLVAPGVPIRFSDASTRVGDMNGDGLTDLVYLRPGDVRYWPGRGDGSWGTGPLGACTSGFAESTYVPMASSPAYSDTSNVGLRVDDVNGDGLDDLVQVRFDAVDVWLNVDGAGFTAQRHVISGLPPAQGPLWASKVRVVDVNGSGARDLLWGEAGKYRYVDLQGGARPWMLTHVDHGLGKTTDIEYATAADLMLAAEAAGAPWQSKAPIPIHVVRSVTERDNLDRVGRPSGAYVTQYTYRDPVYDGRQRELRGFRTAVAERWGDGNSPTSFTASAFALGECVDDEPPPAGVASACDPAGRWVDNPREALKGLPLVAETYDESGAYLSTVHHGYTLRKLYAGLDGRAVRVAFESQTDTWTYDVAGFAAAPTPAASVTDVVLDAAGAASAAGALVTTTIRAAKGTAHMRSAADVDPFGNGTDTFAFGCTDGDACPTSDPTIHSVSRAAIPAGDASGWLWRAAETFVDGASPGEQRQHVRTTYDANGHATAVQEELAGTLALDRFHAVSGAAHAGPRPPGASVDGTITTARHEYDAYGNAISHAGPAGRCRTIEYASDYADLATREHVYAGAPTSPTSAGCGGLGGARGAVDLVTRAAYDRGLAVVTDAFDLHDERTRVVYDGFGLVAAVYKPDPVTPGATSTRPSVVADYDFARPDRPYSIIHTGTQDGASDADDAYRDVYAYTDGLGRGIVTIEEADPAVDLHAWVASGLTEYDAKGSSSRAYLAWFWDGDPRAYAFGGRPAAPYTRARYDAFGRQVQAYALDGMVVAQTVHHALSVDAWDAGDLAPGPHAGTYATTRQDGHGRAVSVIERAHVAGGAIEQRETRTDHLTTGEPFRITRSRARAGVAGGDDVVRWLRYDTLGRLVLNVEPDTSKGFTADVNADASAIKAWRYAYDDVGDLVGSSDARGCGADYLYDAAGRVIVEDYSPCLAAHAPYSAPDAATGAGAEVYYQYDEIPADLSSFAGCSIDPRLARGRLVVTSDRGARFVTGVDGRGRATCMARQLARPGAGAAPLATRYAPRWYARSLDYDGADRPVVETTGAVALRDPHTRASATRVEYTERGAVRRVASTYGGADGVPWSDLVSAVTHDADGLVLQIVYGDLARTTTVNSYDSRRRLASVQTYRGPPAEWTTVPAAYAPAPDFGSGTPSTLQLLLEDADYAYDAVDEPIEIHDWRTPGEWPAGAQPVSRTIQYDDLHRIARVDYAYPGGADSWVDPFADEDASGAVVSDRRRAAPSPHLAFERRPLWQTFAYDWLGNTASVTDDAGGFYDRSLGTIVNGVGGAGGLKPYQLTRAAGGIAPRDGSLGAAYDDAGELIGLVVVRGASAPCAPGGGPCGQRFAYDWDEVGRLARARRWDTASPGAAADPPPDDAPAADLRFAYDASDRRVLKTATAGAGPTSGEVHSAYVFDSLELRGAAFDGADYEDGPETEVPYLRAHGVSVGRVHFAPPDLPASSDSQIHVLLELPDALGSDSIVIDRATSELVERTTYLPFGATESDLRPARWGSYRSDHRFTGKEEDVEVGLTYFGKRYLSPALGRWVSADPLTIHGLGADANAYAYVKGKVFTAVDPNGLSPATALAHAVEHFVPFVKPYIDLGSTIRDVAVSANDNTPARWVVGRTAQVGLAEVAGAAAAMYVVVRGAYEWIKYGPAAEQSMRDFAREMMAPVSQREWMRPRATAEAPKPPARAEPGAHTNEEKPEPKERKKRNAHLANGAHPVTKVMFDSEARPLFKSYADVTLPERLIGPTVSDNEQFQYATRELARQMAENPLLEQLFTHEQLEQVRAGAARIDGYTWHHHARNLLQLVDRAIHALTGHDGGRKETGGRPAAKKKEKK